MRRSIILGGIAVTLALGVASQGPAQYEEEKPAKVFIKIGVHRPSGSVLRDRTGSIWKALGIDYALTLDQLGRARSLVSFERVAASEEHFKGQLMGLTYSGVWRKQKNLARSWYFGVGTGMHILSEEMESHYNGFMFTPGEKYSSSKLGFSVLGGYDFGEYWFAELRYRKIGELADGMDFSGLTLYVGAKGLF